VFNYVLPGSTWVTFQRCKISQTIFSCCDMDAEDLPKAALSAIDDWLDKEIVGFEEPEEEEEEEEEPVASGA